MSLTKYRYELPFLFWNARVKNLKIIYGTTKRLINHEMLSKFGGTVIPLQVYGFTFRNLRPTPGGVQSLTLLYTIFHEKGTLLYAFYWKTVPLSHSSVIKYLPI